MTSKQQYDLTQRVGVLYNYIGNVRSDVSNALGFFTSDVEQEIYNSFTQAMSLVAKCEALLSLIATKEDPIIPSRDKIVCTECWGEFKPDDMVSYELTGNVWTGVCSNCSRKRRKL